jgi:hypothetical protein
MSGISEIDIRDFNRLNVRQARIKLDKAVGDPDILTYGQMDAIAFMEDFLSQIEKLQNQALKQVPVLFKRKESK